MTDQLSGSRTPPITRLHLTIRYWPSPSSAAWVAARLGRGVRKRAAPAGTSGSAAPASLNVHFGADLQRPVACGGVAVIPGDILVGDGDGVVVVPRRMAAEVARDGAEQERLEGFLKQRVESGHPTIGTYPPNPETLQAYEAWKAQN